MFKQIPAIAPAILKKIGIMLLSGAIAGITSSCLAQNLLAHWSLDEGNSPYSDSGWNGVTLYQDPATTKAIAGPGIAGGEAELNWRAVPGTSTRMFATNIALQTDSFGFSFWINLNYLNNGDNFIAKEMPNTTVVSGAQSVAWQVRVGETNIAGSAPVEFIVRGNSPTNSNFYGNVLSATNLPLFTSQNSWIHIAGGYDTSSGSMILFVNGVQSTSSNSTPGARSSDGSPFDIGTGENGSNYVVFAAGASIDDVQLYNRPLSASDAAFLMSNPGQDIRPFYINQMTYDSTSGNITASIISTNSVNLSYVAQVSSNLGSFTAITNVVAAGQNTVITLPKSAVDGIFGAGSYSSVFLKVYFINCFTGCN
jgi:hypothetical protein